MAQEHLAEPQRDYLHLPILEHYLPETDHDDDHKLNLLHECDYLLILVQNHF
jgi:hypothetical protein